MTNQIQGEILFKGIDKASGQWVYSPWMPVHGIMGSFGIEILQMSAPAPTITWQVETRTLAANTALPICAEQTGVLGVNIIGPSSLVTNPIQELVRYKIATGATSDASKWAVLRVLAPSWQQDGR
jgi:hypothetical protein